MMENVNYDKLESRINELSSLIEKSSTMLGKPVSNVSDQFGSFVCHSSSRYSYLLSRVLRSSRIEQIVIGGVAIGGVYLATKLYDTVRNAMSAAEIKNALQGYYQELITNQELLIEKQEEIADQLITECNKSAGELNDLKEETKDLQSTIDQINAFRREVRV